MAENSPLARARPPGHTAGMDQDHDDYIEPEERGRNRRTMLDVIGIVGGFVGLGLLLALMGYAVFKFLIEEFAL